LSLHFLLCSKFKVKDSCSWYFIHLNINNSIPYVSYCSSFLQSDFESLIYPFLNCLSINSYTSPLWTKDLTHLLSKNINPLVKSQDYQFIGLFSRFCYFFLFIPNLLFLHYFMYFHYLFPYSSKNVIIFISSVFQSILWWWHVILFPKSHSNIYYILSLSVPKTIFYSSDVFLNYWGSLSSIIAIFPSAYSYNSDAINPELLKYLVFHDRDTSIKLSLP